MLYKSKKTTRAIGSTQQLAECWFCTCKISSTQYFTCDIAHLAHKMCLASLQCRNKHHSLDHMKHHSDTDKSPGTCNHNYLVDTLSKPPSQSNSIKSIKSHCVCCQQTQWQLQQLCKMGKHNYSLSSDEFILDQLIMARNGSCLLQLKLYK